MYVCICICIYTMYVCMYMYTYLCAYVCVYSCMLGLYILSCFRHVFVCTKHHSCHLVVRLSDIKGTPPPLLCFYLRSFCGPPFNINLEQ